MDIPVLQRGTDGAVGALGAAGIPVQPCHSWENLRGSRLWQSGCAGAIKAGGNVTQMWGCLVRLRETPQLTWRSLAFEPEPGSSLEPQAGEAEDGIRPASPRGHPAAPAILPSCLGIPGSQKGFYHHSLSLVALPGVLGMFWIQ